MSFVTFPDIRNSITGFRVIPDQKSIHGFGLPESINSEPRIKHVNTEIVVNESFSVIIILKQ